MLTDALHNRGLPVPAQDAGTPPVWERPGCETVQQRLRVRAQGLDGPVPPALFKSKLGLRPGLFHPTRQRIRAGVVERNIFVVLEKISFCAKRWWMETPDGRGEIGHTQLSRRQIRFCARGADIKPDSKVKVTKQCLRYEEYKQTGDAHGFHSVYRLFNRASRMYGRESSGGDHFTSRLRGVCKTE